MKNKDILLNHLVKMNKKTCNDTFLKNLNNVCIGISLDGIGKVGEFCRLGWKKRIWEKNNAST